MNTREETVFGPGVDPNSEETKKRIEGTLKDAREINELLKKFSGDANYMVLTDTPGGVAVFMQGAPHEIVKRMMIIMEEKPDIAAIICTAAEVFQMQQRDPLHQLMTLFEKFDRMRGPDPRRNPFERPAEQQYKDPAATPPGQPDPQAKDNQPEGGGEKTDQ